MKEDIIGVFDGKYLIDENKEFYPVPSNYASKSKLVEGDILSLRSGEGRYTFKQIERIDRKFEKAIVVREKKKILAEVLSDGRRYEISYANASFFKLEDGDQLTVILPKSGNSVGCAIENVRIRNSEKPKKFNKELEERIQRLKKNNRFTCRAL